MSIFFLSNIVSCVYCNIYSLKPKRKMLDRTFKHLYLLLLYVFLALFDIIKLICVKRDLRRHNVGLMPLFIICGIGLCLSVVPLPEASQQWHMPKKKSFPVCVCLSMCEWRGLAKNYAIFLYILNSSSRCIGKYR